MKRVFAGKLANGWSVKTSMLYGEEIEVAEGIKIIRVVPSAQPEGDEPGVGLITDVKPIFDGHLLKPEPPKPTMGWVDVTKECELQLISSPSLVKVTHKGEYVLGLGGSFKALTTVDDYKVSINPTANSHMGSFKVEH